MAGYGGEDDAILSHLLLDKEVNDLKEQIKSGYTLDLNTCDNPGKAHCFAPILSNTTVGLHVRTPALAGWSDRLRPW